MDFEKIKELAFARDSKYSKKFFNTDYFSIIESLISSVLPDGSMTCFIGEKEEPLPESTASTLLFLYRNNLIDSITKERIQNYLMSTNSEVASSDKIKSKSEIDINNCAWSSIEGNNVWSSSQILWTLIATKYNGKYSDYIISSIKWLLNQQFADGGWAFSNHRDNIQNTYITSTAIYTLKLSLKYSNWTSNESSNILNSIEKGCDFILKSKNKKKDFWGFEQEGYEPTTTAMAIWALHHCHSNVDSIKSIINNSITILKNDIKNKIVWDNKVMVNGISSDTKVRKVLQGYTPSIALILLQLGVSPFDEAIISPLNLLLNTKSAKGWDFYSTEEQTKAATGFLKPNVYYVGSGQPMTFTTALALWTIDLWHKKIIEYNIKIQKDLDQLKISHSKKSIHKPVNKNHLLLLLSLVGVICIATYFWGLNAFFNQSIIETIKTLNIKEFSDFIESIAKLSFIPLIIIISLVNFYHYGKFSFKILKKLWNKLFW